MTDFKIKRGLSTTLFMEPGVINPKLIIELGCWYLCIDTAELFLGVEDEEGNPTLKHINSDHVTDEHIVSLIDKYYKEHPETEHLETDPTVPAWAKQPEKPTYTATEVGALPKDDTAVKQTIAAKLNVASLMWDNVNDVRFILDAIREGNSPFNRSQYRGKNATYYIDNGNEGEFFIFENFYNPESDTDIQRIMMLPDTAYHFGETVVFFGVGETGSDIEYWEYNYFPLDERVENLESSFGDINTTLDDIKNTLETSVVVVKNDQTTSWENSSYILLRGEVGIGYLENGNIIVKAGDGEHSWKDLPQIEGVFEEDLTLTYDFGRHKIDNGFVKTPAKGMTTSQWLIDALSETKEPEITQPTFTLAAAAVGSGGEIGTYITALTWDGETTYGSYEYGPDTGLSAINRTWAISNDINDQAATSEDGTFALTNDKQIQLVQESSKKYATITGTYTLDASKAAKPLNNVGVETAGKITDMTGTITADVTATAYRKPFYGVLEAGKAIDISKLSSDIIRGLPESGSSNKGLPSVLDVPIGSQMVIFAAKASVYKSLKATDNRAMNAEISFTKVANAVKVEGANNFEAVDYDIWYVDWNPDKITGYTGIGSVKQLKLVWS